jgi:hypothetical protein
MNDLSEFVSVKREALKMLLEDSHRLDYLEMAVEVLAGMSAANEAGDEDLFDELLSEARDLAGYEPIDALRLALINANHWKSKCQAYMEVKPPTVHDFLAIQMPDSPKPQSYVYFLRRPDGQIKIGKTVNVDLRVKVLKYSSGHDLELMLVLPGCYKKEHEFHKMFSECRRIGEWFSPSPDLMEFIERAILEIGIQQ